MKKIYSQPEWKMSVVEEDVITASTNYTYGSDENFGNSDAWEW